MNIPIKKHTKVRRPMSRWQVNVRGGFGAIRASSFEELTNYTAPVTDLSIGLENPLWSTKLFNCTCSQPLEGKYHRPACFSHANGIDWSDEELEEYGLMRITHAKQQKGDWNKDIEEQTVEEYIKEGNKFVGSTPIMSQIGRPKPSLLTRVKERFKR